MLLTRIWAVILALLATACLAGMFLLSLGSSDDFSESDREAIRAVTEAGVAALEAEIRASPVGQATGVLADSRLREAMARTPEEEKDLPPEEIPLAQILTEVAEELRVRTQSDMTLAIIDKNGAIEVANGIAEPGLGDLTASDAFAEAPADQDVLFSTTIGGEIHVAKVSQPDAQGRRLVAVEALELGGGSLLRRVLGSRTPAGLVRKGKLLGGIIGDQPVTEQLQTLAATHQADTPEDGASKVFTVGDGLNARIGALGRVPGPAGRGTGGALLVVLSGKTAAAGQRDLAEALGQAREKGLQKKLNWPLLIGLLIVSAGLAIYLPMLEALNPLRRLAGEFRAMAQGAQHQIFHDRYGGATGEVARSAVAAHEALRQAYLAELEIDDEEVDEAAAMPAAPPRPATSRRRRLTRASRALKQAKRPKTERQAPTSEDANTSPVPKASKTESPSTTAAAAADAPGPPPLDPANAPPPSIGSPLSPVGPAAAPQPATTGGKPPSGPQLPSSMPSAPRAPVVGTGPVPTVPGAPPPTPAPPVPGARSGATAPPSAAPGPSSRPQTPKAANLAGPAAPAAPPTPGFTEPAPPPAPGAPSSASAPEDQEFREIYDEFLQVKSACGESTTNVSYERFAAKLRKNTRDLKAKRPGIKDVQFSVYVKDGKAALKAKVVKG